MRKPITIILAIFLIAALSGCASTGANSNVSKAATTVATLAKTAPELARQFDAVYAYLIDQKLVPDHRDAATKALAAMDAVAPLVQAGAEQLTGDNFNWASFVLQSALVIAKTMGYVLPLLV